MAHRVGNLDDGEQAGGYAAQHQPYSILGKDAFHPSLPPKQIALPLGNSPAVGLFHLLVMPASAHTPACHHTMVATPISANSTHRRIAAWQPRAESSQPALWNIATKSGQADICADIT